MLKSYSLLIVTHIEHSGKQLCILEKQPLKRQIIHLKKKNDIFSRWLEIAAHPSSIQGCNGALALLREGLGGADEERVSAMMTAEVYDKWMDDTTILFEFL